MFYALGLLSYGGVKILVSTFHALKDTKTPVKVAGATLLINALLNFILMSPLKIGGIALASALSSSLNFLILFQLLNRRLGGFDQSLKQFILKVGAASGAAGLCFWGGWEGINFISLQWLKLIVVGSLGCLIYGLICLKLRVQQAEKILREGKRFFNFQ